MVEIFEVVPFMKGTLGDLPEPNLPHYVLTEEGLYLRRKTAIGVLMEKTYKKPESLLKAELGQGQFDWTGERIPGKLVSQATDYFRRIYDKHKTEAEVIITKHITTDEYKLFVPWQRANGGGVKSIFEPTHVHKDWLVVGTLHSHCHFSAFHSSTDSGDASDMDGVHFTIGMLQKETPDIVAMVAMGGKEYHFKDPSAIAELEFTGHTAPPHWDRFLLVDPPKEAPKGFKTLTQNHWDQFLGTAIAPKKYNGYQSGTYGNNTPDRVPYKQPDGKTPYGEWKDGKFTRNPNAPAFNTNNKPNKWQDTNRKPMNEPTFRQETDGMSKRQIKKLMKAQGYSNDVIRARLRGPLGGYIYEQNSSGGYTRRPYDPNETAEELEGVLIDQVMETAIDNNLFDISEIDLMSANELNDMLHWQKFFMKKILVLQDILENLGLKVDISAKVNTTPIKKETKEAFKAPTPEQLKLLEPGARLFIAGKEISVNNVELKNTPPEPVKTIDITTIPVQLDLQANPDDLILAPPAPQVRVITTKRGAHI